MQTKCTGCEKEITFLKLKAEDLPNGWTCEECEAKPKEELTAQTPDGFVTSENSDGSLNAEMTDRTEVVIPAEEVAAPSEPAPASAETPASPPSAPRRGRGRPHNPAAT